MIAMARHREHTLTLREFEQDLNAIRDLVDPLKRAYRWAYPASLSSSKGERSSSGTNVADDGSVPGSTASVAAGKERMRSRVREAAVKIGQARNDLSSALDELNNTMDALTRDRYEPVTRYPRTASPTDVKLAEEARAKREAAGQGWGEG